MIYLYSGSPGSGKTLHATYRIFDYIKRGKKVITNIVIDRAKLCKLSKKSEQELDELLVSVPNEELTVDFLYDFSRNELQRKKEHQCYIVIDEAGDIYNPRDWDKGDRMAWLKFMRVHRHYGYDMILISQSDRYIDRQIRGCLETEIKHRNVKYYKLFGLLLSLITGGMFITVEYWYPMRLRCSSSCLLLNKRRASIYDTFQCFQDKSPEATKSAGRTVVFTAEGAPADSVAHGD